MCYAEAVDAGFSPNKGLKYVGVLQDDLTLASPKI